MKKYYSAYGSNLNLEQMKYRCPHAKKVGSYLLKDYELEFRYYLTIKKKKGAIVPVGIFEIDEVDERHIDSYEGFPKHYRKETFNVELDGKPIEAIIYIMNEKIIGITPPSIDYFNVCLEGYKDFKFDYSYLFKAMEEC